MRVSLGPTRSKTSAATIGGERPANHLRVWLADLTHYGSGPAAETMPIGIGFIAGFARDHCNLVEPVRLFKYPHRLASAIEGDDLPDVIGFSNYIWNSSLSIAFARIVHERSPSTICVFGGPHFPKEPHQSEEFLTNHPEIDFYVEGEGEQAFARLLDAVASAKNRGESVDTHAIISSEVPSLRWIDRGGSGEFHATALAERIRDLDTVPSPYLSGMLDEFFDGELAPTLQTNRGCPFTCTFCLEGGDYYRKLSSFSEDRVVSEIDYMAVRMQPVIRAGGRDDLLITDSNFAMYTPDRVTCAEIKACRDRFGWPTRVNVTTGKNRRERVLDSIRLTDGAIQLSGAVQSLEQSVLENVNRQNIDAEGLIAIAQQSSERGTPTYSDVILGLPGDTRESHVRTVCTLVNAGFGRINTFQCALLPGTELFADSMRKQFGISTKYRTVPRGHGRYKVGTDSISAVEIDEVCVATSTLSFEDYVWCREFDLALFLLHNDQIMAATTAIASRIGIDLGAFITRAAKSTWPGRLGEIREDYVTATREQLFNTREECEAFALENLDNFTGGRTGMNLLYTFRAIAVIEAVDEIGKLALEALMEDPAAAGYEDLLAEAVRFDVLSLSGLWDPIERAESPTSEFRYDIAGLIDHGSDETDPTRPRDANAKPVEITFELSDASRSTMDAYARAMGDDPSGIGRALTRVPIGDLKRVPRVAEPGETSSTSRASVIERESGSGIESDPSVITKTVDGSEKAEEPVKISVSSQ
jgi:radical SAM superfamily enzyme YgiQ (UPF0313 family)